MKETSFSSTDQLGNWVEIRRHSNDQPWTYAQLDLRQREIAIQVIKGNPGVLLLSELAPVITWGRRTKLSSDLLFSTQEYQKRGIQIHPVNRGGLATFHGPGQWVLFPVDTLEKLTGDSRGVRKVIDAFLQLAFRVGLAFNSSSHIREGSELGVWTSTGKFASVGIHIDRRVVMHGLSLNGYQTPLSFHGVLPCGAKTPVDYLLKTRNEDEFLGLGNLIIQTAFEIFWKKR